MSKYFFVEYDKDLKDVDESILVIPALSAIVTIAWATGADVYVEKLDKAYLNSLNKVKLIFKGWFPQFSFLTKIHTKSIVSNKFSNKGYALLFSGGVDSRASYIRNKERKPTLISIWGADVSTHESKFWSMVKKRLMNFAKREGVKIYFIKTNARELINDELLSKEYRVKVGWWENVCHGIMMLGLCAPLTKRNIRRIVIAASYTKDHKKPWGSDPLIDNNVSWADVRVIHDGYELSRQEKIRHILKSHPTYLSDLRVCTHPTYLSDLRVCTVQHTWYNCAVCEKCWRTITGLVLEDIDPRKCGFPINDGIFDLIKRYFIKGLIRQSNLFFWQDIQRHIPNKLGDNKLYDSKKFLEWFREFDLSNYKSKGDSKLLRLFETYYLAKYLPRDKGIGFLVRRALPFFVGTKGSYS